MNQTEMAVVLLFDLAKRAIVEKKDDLSNQCIVRAGRIVLKMLG